MSLRGQGARPRSQDSRLQSWGLNPVIHPSPDAASAVTAALGMLGAPGLEGTNVGGTGACTSTLPLPARTPGPCCEAPRSPAPAGAEAQARPIRPLPRPHFLSLTSFPSSGQASSSLLPLLIT